MKVKNIVFSGVMGAILMGATGANAAGPISVASRGYVDQQVAGVSKNVSDLDAAKADKATTLAGYGITDAYTAAEIDGKFETQVNAQAKLEEAQADAKQKFEAAQSYTREQIDALRDSLGGTGEDGESTGLTGAVAKNASDIVDLKTQVGEGNVADRISAALTEAKNDATTKANTAEQNAKDYADAELAKKEDIANKVSEITPDNKADGTKYTSVKAVAEFVAGEIDAISGGVSQDLAKVGQDIENLEAAYKQADADLTTAIADAKAAAIADAESKNATLKSDLEGQIATAKADAAADATNKADAAKAGAEKTASDALAAAVAILEGKITDAGTGASGDLDAAKTELQAAIAKAQKDATDAASQDATTKAAAALASATEAVTALADGAVKTNTDAIAAINNTETGILAQAKADAAAQAKAVSDRLKLLATADVPAECESESSMCVLSYNGTTYSWMPLTAPLEYNEQ